MLKLLYPIIVICESQMDDGVHCENGRQKSAQSQ